MPAQEQAWEVSNPNFFKVASYKMEVIAFLLILNWLNIQGKYFEAVIEMLLKTTEKREWKY